MRSNLKKQTAKNGRFWIVVDSIPKNWKFGSAVVIISTLRRHLNKAEQPFEFIQTKNCCCMRLWKIFRNPFECMKFAIFAQQKRFLMQFAFIIVIIRRFCDCFYYCCFAFNANARFWCSQRRRRQLTVAKGELINTRTFIQLYLDVYV